MQQTVTGSLAWVVVLFRTWTDLFFCKFHPIHKYSNAHFVNEERKSPSERHINVV